MGRFFAGVVIGAIVGGAAGGAVAVIVASLNSRPIGVSSGPSQPTVIDVMAADRLKKIQERAAIAVGEIVDPRIRSLLATYSNQEHRCKNEVDQLRNEKVILYNECMDYVTKSGVMAIVPEKSFEEEADQTIKRWKSLRQ